MQCSDSDLSVVIRGMTGQRLSNHFHHRPKHGRLSYQSDCAMRTDPVGSRGQSWRASSGVGTQSGYCACLELCCTIQYRNSASRAADEPSPRAPATHDLRSTARVTVNSAGQRQLTGNFRELDQCGMNINGGRPTLHGAMSFH